MPVINEGDTTDVAVPAGKVLTLSTEGSARVYQRIGLSDFGQYAAQVVAGETTWGNPDRAVTLRIEALIGDVDYTVAYPLVPGEGVAFRRDDDGSVDAVVYGGEAVPVGPGATSDVAWSSISDKPSAFPPEAHTHPISDVTGLQSALDAKVESVSWGDVGSKPSTFPPEAHTHGFSDIDGIVDGVEGGNLQAILEDLVARVAALEGG